MSALENKSFEINHTLISIQKKKASQTCTNVRCGLPNLLLLLGPIPNKAPTHLPSLHVNSTTCTCIKFDDVCSAHYKTTILTVETPKHVVSSTCVYDVVIPLSTVLGYDLAPQGFGAFIETQNNDVPRDAIRAHSVNLLHIPHPASLCTLHSSMQLHQ